MVFVEAAMIFKCERMEKKQLQIVFSEVSETIYLFRESTRACYRQTAGRMPEPRRPLHLELTNASILVRRFCLRSSSERLCEQEIKKNI